MVTALGLSVKWPLVVRDVVRGLLWILFLVSLWWPVSLVSLEIYSFFLFCKCDFGTIVVLAILFFVVMFILQPFVLLFDKQRRRVQHVVNKVSVPYPSLKYISTCCVENPQ